MSLSTRILTATLSFCLSFSAFAGPLSSALRVSGKEGGQELSQTLVKMGLKEASQTQLVDSLRVALRALSPDDVIPSTDEALETMIRQSDRLSSDVKNEIVNILRKDVSDLSPAEVATLNNALATAAEGARYGRSLVACQTCVDQDLLKLGITRLAKQASEEAVEELAKVPAGSALLVQINRLAKSLKVAGVDNAALSNMDEVDRKWLYLALKASKDGTASQKKLGGEILRMNLDNTRNGYIDNKLWLLVTPHDGLSATDMDRMAAVLKQINDQGDNLTPEQRVRAFNDWFERNADTPALKEALENMKNKRSVYNGRVCRGCWCTF